MTGMSKSHRQLALQDHVYDASHFCIHCGAHAEVIADELLFCLTKEQREKVIAISHLRAWQIRTGLWKQANTAKPIAPPEPVETRLLSHRLSKVAEQMNTAGNVLPEFDAPST